MTRRSTSSVLLSLSLGLGMIACGAERPPEVEGTSSGDLSEETEAQMDEFGEELELQTEVTADEVGIDETGADVDTEDAPPEPE